MFSLNIPLSGAVRRCVAELHPQLLAFDRLRERQTFVVKRFPESVFDDAGMAPSVASLRQLLRPVLRGAPAFAVRVDRIDYFAEPVRGPGPVVYLGAESPGLDRLHGRLVDAFGAIDGLEGDAYVPHITLARGGDRAAAERLSSRPIEPIEWSVSRLDIWDSTYRERTGSIDLPA
ncbi:2'-5' RNA ligase family protein [Haloferacaceae archaeon DSL9]